MSREAAMLQTEVARLRAALEACVNELAFAPCRDDFLHTICLKCQAVTRAQQALAGTTNETGGQS